MLKEKTYKGKWWLPNNQENQVSGTLTILPEGDITLETIGELGEISFLEIFASDSPIQHNVIWGIDFDATPISIFGCAAGMKQNTSSPFPLVNYKVQVIALGAHIASLDELGNYDIKVTIPELSLWFRSNCLHSQTDGKDFAWFTNFKESNKLTIPIEDNCQLLLEGEINFNQSINGLNLNIEESTVLKFSFDKPISMQDAKKKVFQFEQFLSFATLSVVNCTHFWLIDKDKRKDSQNKCSIEIIDKRLPRKINTRFWEYLFVHETISKSFDKVIKKWYEEKDLYPIRAHLIDSISHKGYFETNDFLVVCQAIEGFYYRFRKQDGSLTAVIKELLTEFSDIKVLEISETDIKNIQDTRHHYTHLLPTGKKKHVIDDAHELYNLNHNLRKLLISCVLNLIGFTNPEINDIFEHSNNSYLRMTGKQKRTIIEEEPITLKGKILSVTQSTEVEPE